MLVEKVLGNIKDYPIDGRTVEKVYIEWYELDKKLQRKKSDAGEEIGIRVDTHLHEGDILYADEKKVIALDLLPCELTVVEVHTMQEMGRLCFELGNRHLSLSIGEHEVRVPYDEPTFLYLEKLGFAPKRREAKFSNFTVCHAHEHNHNHEHSRKPSHKPDHGYER